MELIFEVLVQFLGEVLLQVVFEVLAELGFRSVKEVFQKPANPWLAAIGYALFGAVAGLLSLLVMPKLLLAALAARIAGLLATPVVAGGLMAALGAWRLQRAQPIVRLDRFAYGYLFALAMAGVRFAFGG